MKIGILGSGDVARALGSGFLRHGIEVMLSSRGPGKLAEWQATSGRGALVGGFADAAAFGDLLVLAVKGSAAGEALDLAGEDSLREIGRASCRGRGEVGGVGGGGEREDVRARAR